MAGQKLVLHAALRRQSLLWTLLDSPGHSVFCGTLCLPWRHCLHCRKLPVASAVLSFMVMSVFDDISSVVAHSIVHMALLQGIEHQRCGPKVTVLF